MRPEGQHPEQSAEDVFALRGPRHGFYVERVESEDAGHEGASTDAARHPCECCEEQQRSESVDQRVGEQCRPWIGSKELHHDQIGDECHRSQHREEGLGQGPANGLGCQSRLHVRVFGDVGEVVQQQELVVAERVIDEGDGKDEGQTDNDSLASAPSRGALRRVQNGAEHTQ
jgi:hypothetical protein